MLSSANADHVRRRAREDRMASVAGGKESVEGFTGLSMGPQRANLGVQSMDGASETLIEGPKLHKGWNHGLDILADCI
jgi:hypothetical protein